MSTPDPKQVVAQMAAAKRKGRPVSSSGYGSSGVAYTPIPTDVPFPVDVLPGPWAEFCRAGAEVLKCDPGLVGLPILGVIAGAVGMTRRIYLGGEWYEPAVFWTCTILDSGGMKTPAAELSVGLVKEVQKKHLARHRAEMEVYADQLTHYRRTQRVNRRQGGDEDDPNEPKRPVLYRVLVGDVTLEKLADIIDDNPRGVTKHADELATHFGGFTRYKSGGGSDEANWLSIHRADAIVYDRKTGVKTSVFVPHAAVSIVGGIQPGTMRRLITQGMFDSGTVPRFVFRLAVRTPKEYVEHGIDPDLKAKAERSLSALYALQPEADGEGLPRPKVLKLAADAKQRWKRFVNDWGRKQFETDGEVAAALSKLEGMAARFALIHHLVSADEWADKTDVRLVSIEAGIRFVEWAANETVRVYRTLNESDGTAETRKLVELVRRLTKKSPAGDRMTGRDLQRSRGEKYPTVEAAEGALDTLVGAGVGRWADGEGKAGRGGKVSRVFVLNPTPDIPDMPDDGGDDYDGGEPDKAPDMPPDGTGEGHGTNGEKPSETSSSDVNTPPAPPPMSGMSGVGLTEGSARQPAAESTSDKGVVSGTGRAMSGVSSWPTDAEVDEIAALLKGAGWEWGRVVKWLNSEHAAGLAAEATLPLITPALRRVATDHLKQIGGGRGH